MQKLLKQTDHKQSWLRIFRTNYCVKRRWSDLELLEEANVSKTDAILAVTDDDKTNMLVAVRAKSRM